MARTLIRAETQLNNASSQGDNWFLRTDGSAALEGDLDAVNGYTITNLPDPSLDGDAANKGWVTAQIEAYVQGLDPKGSVRVATTADDGDLNLSSPPASIDGITLSGGDRVLVKNQSLAEDNGIYIYTGGVLERSPDADETDELSGGSFVFVEQGTGNQDTGWLVVSDGPIQPGTDPVNFAQFSGAGAIDAGDGLSRTGNTIDVVAANSSLNVGPSTIAVNTSDGLTVTGNGVAVEAADSTISVTSTGISVNAGNGLSDGSSLAVAGGTGITVDASGVNISADVLTESDIQDGLVVSGSLVSVDTGDGLQLNGTTGAVEANIGDGLQIDGTGALAVTSDVVRSADISDMFTETEFNAAVGHGLTGNSTGFSIDDSVVVTHLDANGIAGSGLSGDVGGLNIQTGTGITINGSDQVAIDLTAGDGISISGATIEVDASVARTSDLLTFSREAFTGDGNTTLFTLTAEPTPESERVFVNGQFQSKGAGADYTIDAQEITFTYTPISGARIEAVYAP